jgi:hypothetical protein
MMAGGWRDGASKLAFTLTLLLSFAAHAVLAFPDCLLPLPGVASRPLACGRGRVGSSSFLSAGAGKVVALSASRKDRTQNMAVKGGGALLLTFVAYNVVMAASQSIAFWISAAIFSCLFAWAFQGVGPSAQAQAAVDRAPPAKVDKLNALLFGGSLPTFAIYCGAKVRRESYAPLAQAILEELAKESGVETQQGVLVLQSPFNVYAFKPATVAEVLEQYPTVTCVAGHSIGGLWAAEYCRDLKAANRWPKEGLSFFYLGVHGKALSLASFKELPFAKVGWSYATEDVTLHRAAAGDIAGYVSRVSEEELPAGATVFEIAGGNHEQYGSYGSPGLKEGLAYKDLPSTISESEQHQQIAVALVATNLRP